MTMTTTRTTTTRSLGIGVSALPRVRNRSRLVAGAIVLLFAAIIAASTYSKAGNRETVLSLRNTVEQGHVISANDLTTASVAVSGNIKVISETQRAAIEGKMATTRLVAGSLISPEEVTATSPIAPGNATVAALMKPGQYPADLNVGDLVSLVLAPTPEVPASSVRGTVHSISSISDSSGSVSASFVVDERYATSVATIGATGNLAVVVLPR